MNALRRPEGLPRLCVIVATLALINAPIARAQGQILFMRNCNGGTTVIAIPEKPDGLPKRDSDCSKACHAMTERRNKGAGGKPGAHC